jgi:pilus assembly protein CpaB
MRRRIIAMFVAGALALTGAVLLLNYVGGAEARAQAAEESVQVLVVDDKVPARTTSDELDSFVSLVDVPARLVADDAMADLDEVAGLVTTVELLPGDQVLASRFVEPTGAAESVGLPELSLTLEPQRAAGGTLSAGDYVDVFVTYTVETGSDVVPTTLNTELVQHKVLVSRVNGVGTSTGIDSSGAIEGSSTDGLVTVTLAMTSEQAEPVVAGMEAKTVWLSRLDPTTIGDAK